MTEFMQSDMAVVFGLIAVLVILIIWRSLSRLHRDCNSAFDLRDLLMENGRASKAAVVMMGAFAVTTWQFVYFSLNGKMTEGYAGIYVAAWIAPVVARLISRGDSGPPPTSVTATTETTLTVPKG